LELDASRDPASARAVARLWGKVDATCPIDAAQGGVTLTPGVHRGDCTQAGVLIGGSRLTEQTAPYSRRWIVGATLFVFTAGLIYLDKKK